MGAQGVTPDDSVFEAYSILRVSLKDILSCPLGFLTPYQSEEKMSNNLIWYHWGALALFLADLL